MARKAKRDLTIEEQLARGPMDLPLLMLTLLLLGVGLIMVLSASYATAYYDPNTESPLAYAIAQSRYAVVGLLVMYGVSKVNYQYLRALSVPMLIGSFLMLGLVLTPLGVRLNGAKRWLRLLLVAGPTFQPSEIAKVSVILFFAARLSKRSMAKRKGRIFERVPKGPCRTGTERGQKMKMILQALLDAIRISFKELIPYICVVGGVGVLLLLEPHLSGTILVFAGGASVLFAAGIAVGWFVFGIAGVGLVFWFIITQTPYMSARIELWLDPWSDPLGKGYQTIQSMYAIGSGGLLGRGLGKSSQKFLFLPEPENDFIFSVVVEELGLIGGLMILALFVMFVLRGYWLAIHARDRFGALAAIGITTLFAVQVFLNIGVVTNLIPNTGISLPFFSCGGTALIIQLAEVGVMLAISRQMKMPKPRGWGYPPKKRKPPQAAVVDIA